MLAAQRLTPIISLVGLSAMVASSAHGEGSQRVVCWPEEGATEETVANARDRLSSLGEVVDPPASSPDGSTPSTRQLRAVASTYVERAREYYYEAALDEAARFLSEFVDRWAPALAESSSFEELRTVLLWLGASLAKAGRHDEAVEPFVLAIRFGLEEIDRSLFPPEVTRAYEAARASIAGTPTVSVTFVVRPPGATVEIDGRAELTSSESPTERQIAVGRHLVVSRRPGYRPVADLFTLSADATTIEMNLEPADRELIAEQVAGLGRDGSFDASDPAHIALLAQAVDADFVGIVSSDEGAEIALYDANGQLTAWPVVAPPPETASPEPTDPEPPVEAVRPTWRRWWFWFALIGGAAVAATATGLGVHFGTQNRDTFTLVVRR